MRGVLDDLRRGSSPAVVARRFHSTVVEIITVVCRRLREATGVDTAVLSGGVFSNALLSSEASEQLDPLYVANEGKLIAAAPPEDAERLLDVMRGRHLGRDAAIIGELVDEHPGMVVQQSLIGGERVVSMLAGEQLPRIC